MNIAIAITLWTVAVMVGIPAILSVSYIDKPVDRYRTFLIWIIAGWFASAGTWSILEALR